MSAAPQRNIVMILARDFASRLATAVFLVDPQGDVAYYNEAAEGLLGRRFIEGRGVGASEWSTAFSPTDDEGNPVGLEQLPIGVAMSRHEPAHGALWIRSADGVSRRIEVTAFPLFAHMEEYVGAIAFFWETPGEA